MVVDIGVVNILHLFRVMFRLMSATQILNRIGPKILPCETPWVLVKKKRRTFDVSRQIVHTDI